MPEATIARNVIEAVGGAHNVLASTVCMTRLRMTLRNTSAVSVDRLTQIPGVLGVIGRGDRGIEVVFGPAVVDDVYQQFRQMVGNRSVEVAPPTPSGDATTSAMHIVISPGKQKSYAAQAEARADKNTATATKSDTGTSSQGLPGEDLTLDELYKLLESDTRLEQELVQDEDDATVVASAHATGRHILVLNGPNINMLGIREPNVYGTETYSDLIRLCERAAAEAGFISCSCYQSNHEGDLVDQIQQALGTFDAIVINPAAYTHTSVALLDALKAVKIPTVEVHISKVEEREDFRQRSYVRAACIETITGLGLKGYVKAITDLAAYLDEHPTY